MAGFLLFNAISVGVLLVIGQRLFPDFIIMWFTDQTDFMALVREVTVIGLVALALLRPYFDGRLLRSGWGIAAAALLIGGYQYFLNNAAFVLDTLFLLLAGVSFAIAALQTTEQPKPVLRPALATAWRQLALAVRRLETQTQLLNQRSTLHVVNWQNMQNTEHRIMLRRPAHS